jgi:hypothetical protein
LLFVLQTAELCSLKPGDDVGRCYSVFVEMLITGLINHYN